MRRSAVQVPGYHDLIDGKPPWNTGKRYDEISGGTDPVGKRPRAEPLQRIQKDRRGSLAGGVHCRPRRTGRRFRWGSPLRGRLPSRGGEKRPGQPGGIREGAGTEFCGRSGGGAGEVRFVRLHDPEPPPLCFPAGVSGPVLDSKVSGISEAAGETKSHGIIFGLIFLKTYNKYYITF